MPLRVMIFSPNTLMLESFLSPRRDVHLLSSHMGEINIWTALLTARPEMVLMDDALPGQDVLHLMRRIKAQFSSPPKVIYLGDRADEALADHLADAALSMPVDETALLSALDRISAHPLSALATPSLPLRNALTKHMLQELGMPAHLNGCTYLNAALPLLSCLPNPSVWTGKRLYALLAEQFQTTQGAVERAIRTAIEATWLSGHLPAISACFGYTVDPDKGKPTNNEFLTLMALHLQRKTQRELINALS